MIKEKILHADLLDILFENRNKSYGAYFLRKRYPRHLGIALGISYSLIFLFLLFSVFRNENELTYTPLIKKETILVVGPDPVFDEPEKQKKENIQQVKSTAAIKIVPETEEANVAEQTEIAVSNIGTEKIEGAMPSDPNRNLVQGPAEKSSGNETNTLPEKEYVPVHIQASFPGGEQAWIDFLRRYLQTPDELEPGSRVEVRIKFRIDTDGSLSGFEVIKSGGSRFDKEVLRVLKKMPRWIPAEQNHIKVPVFYTQPVIFVGQEG